MIIKKTIHRSYPKPDVNNSLQDDVANIENALDMIDMDIQALKTKIEAAPPIPVLSSSDITITSFTLSWPRVIEATYYCLDIATDETFSTFIAEYNNKKISETSLNITGLESNTVYYCRIRSAFNLVNSGNSTIHMVRTPLNLIEKSQTFNYTGSMETWTVPQYVTALTIEAWGGSGCIKQE